MESDPGFGQLVEQYRQAKKEQQEAAKAAQDAINLHNSLRAKASNAEDQADMLKKALLKKLDEG